MNQHLTTLTLFASLALLPSWTIGQWAQSYGDSSNTNEVRIVPPSDCTIVYTSLGRDFIYLDNCPRSVIWVGQWEDCPLRLYPANVPGGGYCQDGRYDQVHYFNCGVDVVNLSSMPALDPSEVIWFEAPPGYSYHYLVVDQIGDGCNITWAIAFRSDRFYGTFSIPDNVVYNEQVDPLHLDFEEKDTNQQPVSDQPQTITVRDLSGREVYVGPPEGLRLPAGLYVAISGNKRWKMMITNK